MSFNDLHRDLPVFNLTEDLFSLKQCLQFCMRMILLVLLIVTSSLAKADEQDTVNFIAGMSRTLDDNFFRRPSPVSETITATNVGVRVDKPYSMQRLKFEYTLTNLDYQNNTPLNFSGNNYKAEWLWALTPRLTGSISQAKTQSQYGFLDATYNSKPAISTTEVFNFYADWAPQGNLHFLGGGTHTVYKNSSNFQADRGNTVDAIDLGIRYVLYPGAEMSLMEHHRQGEYSNIGIFSPNAFNENESEAKINWTLTGKSALNMRAAYVDRTHKNANGRNFSYRDYDGLVGNANFIWAPTAKLQLAFLASTDIGTFQTNDANYFRSNMLSFNPQYAFTEKLLLRGALNISERLLEGGQSNRADIIKAASISIDWTPRRYVDIGANLQKSSRSSNVSGFDFTDLSSGLTANIHF